VYVELPPSRIFNWLDPFNVTAKWACKAITGDWWSEENVAIRRYFADTWTKTFDDITGHFTDLEESIKEKGILTPVNVESGPPRGSYLKPFHFPPEQQKDLSQAIFSQMFGGSRLTLAGKLGIEKVPAVIHDYANLFPNAVEVNASNYRNWFGNEYSFGGGQIRIISSSHIKNKRFDGMNTNTKRAQQEAATVARKSTYDKFGLKGDI